MGNIKPKEVLSIEEGTYLKDSITFLYDELDAQRRTQKQDIEEVENAIFMNSPDKFQMTDLFELYQTFKAHIWENLYSNIELLFDVKGLDETSEKNASIQKRNLQRYFEMANLQAVLDNAIDYLIRKSEAIVFIGWKMKDRFVRRKKHLPVLGENGELTSKFKSEIVVETQRTYDGLDLKAIDPEHIVFDVDKQKYFIYQSFVTLSELENLSCLNCVDDVQLKKIKEFAKNKSKDNIKGIVDGKIELLEYWGDIRLSDGSLLKNQVIVVAAREFVVRKEDNPYIINPFVVMEILKDPKTQRGFVYLKTALPMKEKSQQIFINQLRALEFITNPAYLAPKGAFANIDQSAEPGKIIEYEPALMPQAPIPLNMAGALQGWEFLNYLKNVEETSTGIFKNFAGVIDKARSATEVQATVGGQNSRLAMIIDLINQNLVIPVVEKSAELLANLIFEQEEVFISDQNKKYSITVNDEVRCGNYKYIYGDRNSVQLRKFKAKEMFDICGNLLKVFPELKNSINAIEAFKFVLEQYGYDNFERFSKDELSRKTNFAEDFFTKTNGIR